MEINCPTRARLALQKLKRLVLCIRQGKKGFHKGNCPWSTGTHQNRARQNRVKSLITTIGVLALCAAPASRAQEANRNSPATSVTSRATNHRPLNKSDRSSVVAVALTTTEARHAGTDCSHLVHSIYQRAGFPYQYADSEDLYDGAKGFQRVTHPQAADLVVWHGHVGIVVRPTHHQFFSVLSKGPGIDDYHSRYWKSRGQPRFYRYLKGDS